ncbi:peptidoglycan DD-metalloendopeptidase family protein [Lacinutrix sp. C3R15]|uniref:peptidoglycan DD-metalloendopeptidase family protein n=1 Tax=Flavobacteriaceae TaxID=49546 RepID=UPI001C087460|nr:MULTISPECIES: peptidoglycan DD-metalloendopeptidase family protein [Flavobacteriaceae]MBU2939538.1 peptidoglycan DD-metalloendopeptidase family protein [Lacinutrix sp. C3R15]MDO6622853.1 peptidoglycan DD-metalloendopeptidase family protein [Oceanihabitans sp. 1_MG-2023]
MKSKDFFALLNNISTLPIHVIDATIPISQYIAINVSENNIDLNTFNVSSSLAWQEYIDRYLQKHHKKIAFGGYLEQRNIYKRSTYFNQENNEEERNIHLGVDLWVAAGTKILTPLDATVHSFKNNTHYGDYGPTIILKHIINEEEFFTLYGHLSVASIQGLKVGQYFKAGECIATLGDASVNGDYAPHLHFQIIKDLENNVGDYPGVCSKKNLDRFKINCPDPNTLLKLNY